MSEFNNIDLENPTKDITEFSKTDAGLAELTERYSAVPDAGTADGYDFIKGATRELTGLRSKIEKARKSWKAPFLDAGKKIDSEAKRITSVLEGLEKPYKEAKAVHDNKVALEKERRIRELTAKIDAIKNTVNTSRGKPSIEIQAALSEVQAIDALEGFFDLTDLAIDARLETMEILEQMLSQQISAENIARENAELKRQLEESQKAAAALVVPEAVPDREIEEAAPVRVIQEEDQKVERAEPVSRDQPLARGEGVKQPADLLAEFFIDNDIYDVRAIAELIVSNNLPIVNVSLK